MNEAEKYINEHTNYRSNFKPNGFHEWVTPDDALRACEIIKQETIKKACEWLEEHMWEKPELDEYCNIKDTYVCSDDCSYVFEFIEQIRKALED
jgi:hypothetical protein